MIGIVPDINKRFILGRLSQEEILERYLGVEVTYTERFQSPLRKDDTPTCSFKKFDNGTVWFKDWSGHFQGDCFNVVSFMYACNFYEACEIIAHDFNLVENSQLGIDYERKPKEYVENESKEVAKIQVQWGEFEQEDVNRWASYGINTQTLHTYWTGVVKHAWLNGSLVYSRLPSDPCYGYFFEEGIYKLYFPNRTKVRFLGNHKGLQGYAQLPLKGKLLVITKSLKDVMFLCQMGIAAVAPPSESSILTEEQYKELSNRFSSIVSLYDFDLTGIRSANKMRKVYDIVPFFFTNGRFGTRDYGGKDATDIAFNKGSKEAEVIIRELLW